MVPPVQAFHYVADVSGAAITAREVSVYAEAIEDHAGSPLIGSHPRIRFLDDRMVLISAPEGASNLKWCSFIVGDVVPRAVRAGDRLDVRRTTGDGVVVCIFRKEQLLLAVGALAGEDLGSDVSIRRSEWNSLETCFDIVVAGEQRSIGDRDSATVGGYDVYVEFAGPRIRFGNRRSESISIAPTHDSVAANEARRSAVLMVERNYDALCGERIDGTMIKSRYAID